MKIKSQKDFFSGLMFMAVGVAFAWGATTYNIGEGARMGPGYFPLVLGILLAGLGAFIIFESLVVETEDGEPIGKLGLEAAGLHHRLQPDVRRAAGRLAQHRHPGVGPDRRRSTA